MDSAKVIQQHKKLAILYPREKSSKVLTFWLICLSSTSSGDLRDEYENIVMTYRKHGYIYY